MFGSYVLSIAITLPDISEYLKKLIDIIIKSGHSFFAIKAAENSKRLDHFTEVGTDLAFLNVRRIFWLRKMPWIKHHDPPAFISAH